MSHNKLPTNLAQLQNVIKRDPESYREEFESQFVYYLETMEIFKLSPSAKNVQFDELVMFLAQVAQCYPDDEELRCFPQQLVELLQSHGPVMQHEIRLGLVKALILMRNKDLLPPLLLISICFQLLRCQDKALRKLLQLHIVTDIKNINAKSKNMVLNREIQNFLRDKLQDNHAVAVKTAVDVMIELYRKRVWTDDNTVNIIVTACYSKVPKIMVAAMKFFVGNDEGEQDESSDSDSDNDGPTVQQAMLAMKVNKKTKQKRQNKLEKIKKVANETKKKNNKNLVFDFSALHKIRDPQAVSEKIFKIFNKRNERFEVKLLMMNMVSRLIGVHQLYLPNFYPTLQRYLYPHQREVTKVMTYAAQAAHPLVPPDELYPVLRTLADNFVTERYSFEVMSMGLNAIRELCTRNEHAMDEDLLHDLVEYRNHKDKGVYMAARSLMALFRLKNPEMLERKTRGAPTELIREEKQAQFGENTAKSFIPGAEILAFHTKAEEESTRMSESECDEDSDEDSEDGDGDKEATVENGTQSQLNSDCLNNATDAGDESESEEYDSDCDGDGEEEENSDEEMDCDEEWESEKEENSTLEQGENGLKSSQVQKNVKAKVNQKGKIYQDKREAKGKVLKKKQAIREVMKLTPQERAEKSCDVVMSRFLTDADFNRIDAMQAAKQVERFKNKNKSQKRKVEDTVDYEGSEIVKLSNIEMIFKKRRNDKEAKMRAMFEGRDGREFGSRKGRSDPYASTTNREKSKAKNFDMVKHKKRYIKNATTFRDKQRKLKTSMLRKLKSGN